MLHHKKFPWLENNWNFYHSFWGEAGANGMRWQAGRWESVAKSEYNSDTGGIMWQVGEFLFHNWKTCSNDALYELCRFLELRLNKLMCTGVLCARFWMKFFWVTTVQCLREYHIYFSSNSIHIYVPEVNIPNSFVQLWSNRNRKDLHYGRGEIT